MPTKTNTEHLASLNPKYKANFMAFINQAILKGWKPQINSSYRDFNQSISLNKENKLNPLNSLHNYGLAIDVQFSKGPIILGKTTNKEAWLNSGLVTLAKNNGLAWGGGFTNYIDNVHFYIPGLNASNLLTMAHKQFKTKNLSLIPGNKLIV